MRKDAILVTGATGAQGGATARALLDRGIPVRALVRSADSAAARALAALGAELVVGDFDDPGSLARAAAGVAGVFSVQLPPRPGAPDSEVRTGRRLVEAALAAGVPTFVHTSVARAGDDANFAPGPAGGWAPGYWRSKAAVNALVAGAGFARWTIRKPAFMMDNFIPPKAAMMYPALREGRVETAMAPSARLDLIAADDVGAFAAAAFAEPARFDRHSLPLAGDSLTMAEVAATIGAVTGKTVTARSLSPEAALRAGIRPGVLESQQWASVEGYKVDRAALTPFGVPLEDFAGWAARHRAQFDLTET